MICLDKLQRELASLFSIDAKTLPQIKDILLEKGYTKVAKGDEIKDLSAPDSSTTFTDTKGEIHEIPKDTADLWLKAFDLESLEQSYTPQFTKQVQQALDPILQGEQIQLNTNSLLKLMQRDRLDFLPYIKDTLENSDIIVRDKENALIFAKDIGHTSYFTSVSKNDKGEWIISTNSYKTLNQLKNRADDKGEVLYISKEAPNILTETFTAKMFSSELAEPIISQKSDINAWQKEFIEKIENDKTYKIARYYPQQEALIVERKINDAEVEIISITKEADGSYFSTSLSKWTSQAQADEYKSFLENGFKGKEKELLAFLEKQAVNIGDERLAFIPTLDKFFNLNSFSDHFTEFFIQKHFGDTHTPYTSLGKVSQKAKYNLDFYIDKLFKDNGYPFGILINNEKTIQRLTKDKELYVIKGKGAIETLLTARMGHIQGAFYRKELGDIDLVWGEVTDFEKHKGYGLAHILDKRKAEFIQQGLSEAEAESKAREFAKEINNIIQNGRITSKLNEATKIETDEYKLILKQNWSGKPLENKWLVTAYIKNEKGESISSTPFTKEDNLSLNSKDIIPQNLTAKQKENLAEIDKKIAYEQRHLEAMQKQLAHKYTPAYKDEVKAELEHILKFATGSDREPLIQGLKNLDKEVADDIAKTKIEIDKAKDEIIELQSQRQTLLDNPQSKTTELDSSTQDKPKAKHIKAPKITDEYISKTLENPLKDYEKLDTQGKEALKEAFMQKFKTTREKSKKWNNLRLILRNFEAFDSNQQLKQLKEANSSTTFTDTKGREHALTKEVQEQWLNTFNLKSLDESYTPKLPQDLQTAIGKEIKLTKGSLYKIIEKGREQYIPQIKETLEKPDFALRDSDDMLIIAKEIGEKQYFTSINLETKDYFISISNAPKKENILKNKVENGAEVIYQSPNAKSIFYTDTLLQEGKSPTNKIDSDIIPQAKQTHAPNPTPPNDSQDLQQFIEYAKAKQSYITELIQQATNENQLSGIQTYAKRFNEILPIQKKINNIDLLKAHEAEAITGKEFKLLVEARKDFLPRAANAMEAIIKADQSPKAFDDFNKQQRVILQANDLLKQNNLERFYYETEPKPKEPLESKPLESKAKQDPTQAQPPQPKPQQTKAEQAEPTFLELEAQKLRDSLQIPHESDGGFMLLGFGRVGSDKEILEKVVIPQARQSMRKGTKESVIKQKAIAVLEHNRQALEKQTNTSPNPSFGTNFAEHYHSPKTAIEKLLLEQRGQVAGAFYRKELGDIDLVWGEVTDSTNHKGYGLAHIIDKHPDFDMFKIPEIIESGTLEKTYNGYNLATDDYIVGLNKGFKDESGNIVNDSNVWIVTSFERQANAKKEASSIASVTSNYIEPMPQKPSVDSTTKPQDLQEATKQAPESAADNFDEIIENTLKEKLFNPLKESLDPTPAPKPQQTPPSLFDEPAQAYQASHQPATHHTNLQETQAEPHFTYTTTEAKSINDLRRDLKEALEPYKSQPIINKQTKMQGVITSDEINKISSKKAVDKSVENGFSRDEHFKVAGDLKTLFENSVLKQSHNDYKNSPNILQVHRFTKEISINGKEANAQITLFEKIEGNNRIYTLELESLNKPDSFSASVLNTESAAKAQSVATAHTETTPIAKTDTPIIPQKATTASIDTYDLDSTPALKSKVSWEDTFLGRGYDAQISITNPEQRLQANLEALKIIKKINETPDYKVTFADQEKLIKFSGFGGLTNAFKESSTAYRELQSLVSADELASLRQTILDAYYTPAKYVRLIYDTLESILPKEAQVLEPSMGVGRFIALGNPNYKYTGIDLDKLTYKIARALQPHQNLAQGDYLRTPISPNQFDLVVGNPPYGDLKVKYKDTQGLNIHSAFMLKNIDMAKDNGIIAQVITSSFLDSPAISTTNALKEVIKKAKLVGVLRLPSDSFAGTTLSTDIMILQKRAKPLSDDDLSVHSGITEAEAYILNTNKKRFTSNSGEQAYENIIFSISPYEVTNKDTKKAFTILAQNRTFESGNFGTIRLRYNPLENKEFESNLIKEWQERVQANLEKVKPSVKSVDNLQDLQSLQKEFKQRDIGKINLKNGEIYRQELEYLADGTKIIKEKKQSIEELALHNETKDNPEEDYKKYLDLIKKKDTLKGSEKAALTRFTKKINMAKEFFKTYEPLKSAQKDLRKAELDPNISDETLEQMRQNLNNLYDETIKNLSQYTSTPHFINNAPLRKVMETDMDFTELQALEKVKFDKDNGKVIGVEKADIFYKRLTNPSFTPTQATSLDQALQYSMQYKGQVNYEYIAKLLGKDPHEARAELIAQDRIFIIDEKGTEGLRDELLSGNAREKLERLRQALKDGLYDEAMLTNSIQTIESNLPPLKTFDQIKWDISSTFIPLEVFNKWYPHLHITQLNDGRIYASAKGGWKFAPSLKDSRIGVTDTDVFNNAVFFTSRSFKSNEDAVRFDKAVENMRKHFEAFVLGSDEMRNLVEKGYNNKLNIYANQEHFDLQVAKNFKFPNANPDIQLRPTQIRAIFRSIYDRNNTLLNHEVGAGKTFTLITSAMELVRIGKAKKPMIAVPNHLVPQFTNEFYMLYPHAKLLSLQSLGQKNFKVAQAQMIYSEFDCIIVGHSVLNKLEMPKNYMKAFYEERLSQTREAINRMDEAANKIGVRNMEKQAKTISEKIAKIMEKETDSKNVMLDFDELGIDALLLDEAHEYKNLAFNSSYTFKGMGKSSTTDATENLLMKTNFLNQNNKKIIFATGTPMSNSLLEVHHMMNYLNPQGLKDLNIQNIDNFIANFVRADKILETKADGSRIFTDTITGVKNANELITMVNKVFDTIDFAQVEKEAREAGIEVVRPNQKNSNVVIEKYDEIKRLYDEVILPESLFVQNEYHKAMEQGITHLSIFTKARKLSVDPRLLDNSLVEKFKSDETLRKKSKIYKCAENIIRKDREWDDRIATQIVFCDLKQSDNTPDFHSHEMLKQYLLDDLKHLGANYTKDQIVCIDAIKKENYAKLYDDINQGKVRILITTTEKTGTGANLQRKLVAMHHLDAPYRPSDFIQRIGRMIRQGNEYAIRWADALKKGDKNEREFYAENLFYITQDTLDSRMFEILENKARAFANFFKGQDVDLEVNAKEMVDYAILKAESSGNKNELEFYKVSHKLQDLNLQKQLNLEEFMNKSQKLATLNALKQKIQSQLELLEVFKPSAKASEVEFMDQKISFDFSKSQDKPNTLAFDDESEKATLQTLRDFMNKNKKQVLEPITSGKQNFLRIYSYGGADLVVLKDNLNDELGFCFEKDGQRLFIDARRKVENFNLSDTLNFIKTLHTKSKEYGQLNKNLADLRTQIKRTEALSAEFAEQDKINALESYLKDLGKAIEDNIKEPIEKPAEVAKFYGFGAIGLGLYASFYNEPKDDYYTYKL